MAEINIQRKKKTVSPWLLILLVLVLIGLGIWYLVSRDPGPRVADQETAAPTAPAPVSTVTPGAPTSPAANENPNPTATGDPSIGTLGTEADGGEAVDPADFYAFVADDPSSTNYTQRGLMMLRNVLVDMSDRPDLRSAAVSERRNDLTSATSRLTDGGSPRTGLVAAAALMQEMQRQGYPTVERETKALVEKANQLSGRPTTPAEQQATQQFFQQAANVLRVLEKPAGA
jgi:hypothetical protein